MKKQTLYFILLLMLISCKGSDTKSNSQTDASNFIEITGSQTAVLPIPNNQVVDHYQILFMGNSHVRGIDTIINELIETRFPEKQVTSSYAHGSYYLSERIKDKASVDTLINTPWTHIILQAQKYSSSGVFSYPIDAAVEWIKLAKTQGSTPIMFPEHPQLGNKSEGMKVHLIHKSIVENEAACIAPVGLAWDRAIELYPEFSFHHSDGNHANTTGKLLTAFIFYQIITGELADELPYIETIDVNEVKQNILRQIASYSLEQNPACEF